MSTDAGHARGPTAWRLAPVAEGAVAHLEAAAGVSRVVARILVRRGITDADAARRFLTPDLARDWADPGLVAGMAESAERVALAVRNSERILVFGDFDLDGVSAAAVAARGLAKCGADVDAVVPNRFRDGYGLSVSAVDRLSREKPDLIITVDCGISSAEEVGVLRERGIDVVVTDHHEPAAGVPRGVPVADPKLGDGSPSRDLAGAGVALKLVDAVGRLLGCPDVWEELTDIAALGTVADIVPLVGENRALVAHGLSRMRTSPRVSIASLAAEAGISLDTLSAESIAFGMAPRFNAAGRMADPEASLRLLLTDDPGEAEELARALDEYNRVRQEVERELTKNATATADREFRPGDRALVLAGEGWHEGVKGIVASRLVKEFAVPVFLFSIEDGEARGSGRTSGDVDVFAALGACADVLTRFGGHQAAVGLALPADDLPRFKESILEYLAQLPAGQFETEMVLDAVLDLDDASIELAAEMDLLEPFGCGNPRPVFLSEGVFMNSRQRVGRSANHLRFTAYDGAASVKAIMFRCPDIERLAAHDAAVDLAYEISVDEWRGRTRVQLRVRDVHAHETGERPGAFELVEDLFEHAEEIIAREEYGGIEDAESFHTKLAGVTFEGRQDVVRRLDAGTPLRLVRQPDNPHDANAIALFDPRGDQVGFLNRRLAGVLARVADAGVEYDVEVTDVTGGEAGRSYGVNVLVTRRSAAEGEDVEDLRAARRAELAELAPTELDEALGRELIGDRPLHPAQEEALAALAAGRDCLAVMATGRGKSLIFHLHAARVALKEGRASVFVYPLRALVSDQAYYLEERLGSLGLSVAVLTGESAPGARDEIFAGLEGGGVDVVLTTPEFLDHHGSRFAATGRVGFAVVDEAHHVASSRAGHRPAYGRLGEALQLLGNPTVLAVTATAGEEVAATIRETLGIETVVIDPTTRDNLAVKDSRCHAKKDDYIAALAAKGEKTIVYVNSREQTVRLARMLRKRAPEIAYRVAFYNGGLSRSARHAVERAFRSGEVVVIVATSAFGEGVNIPDIRNVVLYHLPFNDIEFNQMCGRAGRDGASASVHVLFGPNDGQVNDIVLSSVAPDRDDLAALYTVLCGVQTDETGWFEITNAELADRVGDVRTTARLNERGVSSGIGVFRELGFLEGEGHGPYRRLRLLPRPEEKVDLASSVRYAEGLQEIEEFAEFREWALATSANELLVRFNRPILPSRL
ncbi:MAG: single-stranded-DNA-specific exonuclease RecJ [Coriobacteriia bacterium]|nr:single-stranded-DNA-specific exonuclease RecJ [Coriobacteriia bacterium]